MDLELFRSYKAETDPKKAKRMRDKLAADNMPLVHKLVARYHRKNLSAADLEDVMQAGAIALLKTIDIFDPEKGAFSTILTHRIRDEVQKCVPTLETIKRPKGSGVPFKIHEAQVSIRTQKGREGSAEEIETRAQQIAKRKGGDVDHIKVTDKDLAKWEAWPTVTSIDAAPHDDSVIGHGLHDMLADDGPGALSLLEDEESRLALLRALGTLTEREQRVIQALFFEERSYASIIQSEGIGLEWIRQIRLTAIAKLKAALESE